MLAPNFHQIRKSLTPRRLRFFPFLLLPSLTATALLLTGALGQQASSPSQPAAPAPTPPPKADPTAERVMQQAIEELDSTRLGWLETKLQQEVYAEGLTFKADGRYLSGPEHRLRLELTVHLGSAEGVLQIVSDGSTVWEEVHIGKGERFLSKWDLKKVQEKLNTPGTMPQIGEQFYRSHCFAGVVPLLQNVRDQMTFIKREEASWHDQKVLKLTAVWSAEVSKNLVPPGNPWPPLVPRLCRLYLADGVPHWPYRLEWLGPATVRGEDTLLLQMEFLNPHFLAGKEKPPAGFAQQFTFDPGKAKVTDRTQQITDLVAAQVQNQPKGLLAPPQPPAPSAPPR